MSPTWVVAHHHQRRPRRADVTEAPFVNAVYDISGLITETEARNLFKKAKDFVALIRGRLKTGN